MFAAIEISCVLLGQALTFFIIRNENIIHWNIYICNIYTENRKQRIREKEN